MSPEMPDDVRNDVAAMRNAVLFEGAERRRRLTRFWLLLGLSSVIAASGVVANSSATVIGAMIVAPMMLPIQGISLSTVLADGVNLVRSIVLVVLGALAAIGIGFVIGLLVSEPVVAATDPEVASRVSPDLIDLVAALATGAVGAVALVRSDISDTLPGVAIAISLVPPLTVVGLTLESGAPAQAAGALLLFVTNVAAILATGIVILAVYGARPAPGEVVSDRPIRRRNAVIAIAAMVVIVAVPLAIQSVRLAQQTARQSSIRTVAQSWAQSEGWELVSVTTANGTYLVRVTGVPPVPATDTLETQLQSAGVDPSGIEVDLVPSYTVDLHTPSP
ncbi:DUF389 domain-containing protein [Diaminobutyricibacter sp. McL0608]|uniref:DUF389 domain-containing protein n=1 Tax=Leifsonia sp. McL0608 TaxID=3143537 RepID=UPI0031F2E793